MTIHLDSSDSLTKNADASKPLNTFIQPSIMPLSQGNETGTSEPAAVPYGPWDSFPEQPFPLYAGSKSIIYRSADRKVVVGMLREKGTDTLVWPVDEFLFVTQGIIDINIHGGQHFTLGKGDVMVMKKGQKITFTCSDNFANVAVFIDMEGEVTLV
ncbi:hypothetical protein F1880_008914 [Penicillium rolfsii]|nr:hypothetical protein F1880_008914 [Penicillium rolfsii]